MGKDGVFRTAIGGQALIEGIMMRGPEKTAYVARTPDGLEAKEEPTPAPKKKFSPAGWPVIRGVVGFALSLIVGMRALSWSAAFFPEEEGEPSKFERWLYKTFGSKGVEKFVTGAAMVLGVLLAVGLFTFLPTLIGSLLEPFLGSGFLRNLAETLLRVLLLLGYMLLVSRMKDIQRVFGYHGAEHKSIACYEARKPLTVENVRSFSRRHPRCGTSFLLTVVLISLVAFMLVTGFHTVDNYFLRVLIRLAILPLVVGVSYEINRYIGMHDGPVSRFLRAPGLWMQGLTTREPDDSMIEVAIKALEMVVPAEKDADAWERG